MEQDLSVLRAAGEDVQQQVEDRIMPVTAFLPTPVVRTEGAFTRTTLYPSVANLYRHCYAKHPDNVGSTMLCFIFKSL